MSAEIDFRAALVAESTLVALVGQRVVQNGIEEGSALPYVVFTTSHSPEYGLDGTVLVDQVAISAECWASSALEAEAVADAVALALRTQAVAIAASATITSRASGFDAENGLDATVLAVEWWR